MAATTPARRTDTPRRPNDVDSVHPGLPRPGQWAAPDAGLADPSETLSAVRAELAQLRALLDL